jgi:hypothetical protein
VLGTQVRVDENRLRRKLADSMPKLLLLIKEEESRLAIEG